MPHTYMRTWLASIGRKVSVSRDSVLWMRRVMAEKGLTKQAREGPVLQSNEYSEAAREAVFVAHVPSASGCLRPLIDVPPRPVTHRPHRRLVRCRVLCRS